MSKHTEPAEQDAELNDPQLKNRRDFLKSLGKWSTIIISGIALGGIVAPGDAAGWLNGGGGGAWINSRDGGGGWVNRSGGGGGGWVNRSGGGGGSWVNRRGY
jgi:hypothetical protein